MQTFDAEQTHARLPCAALVDALRALAIEGCVMPPRQVHSVAGPDGRPAGSVLTMTAWQPGRQLGVKTVSVFAGNLARGLPSLHGVYLLFDATTGVPLAQIDGAALTSRRTACVSALAASYLARPDASRLLVVGAGRVASLVPAAMAAVRRVERVEIWNRHRAGADALAQRLRVQGIAAEAVDDLRAAVERAHIVSCATLATDPLVRGEWLRPGTHVDLIGAFTPQMREADAACIARARVFVDQDEALAKAGDLVQAKAEGAFSDAALCGTLDQLCRGECVGRTSPARAPETAHSLSEGQGRRPKGAPVRDGDVTLFKSVGSAWQDLAAAQRVVARPTP